MHIVQTDDVRSWLTRSENLVEYRQGIGRRDPDDDFGERTLQLPLHVQFAVDALADESDDGFVPEDVLDSIPFYSLCRGLFLPLSYLSPERVRQLFGLKIDSQPDSAGREALIREFLDKEVGLTLTEKLGCVLGDVHSLHEIPRLIALWKAGRIDLESLITQRRPLAEINEALEDLRASRGIRTVLTISGTP